MRLPVLAMIGLAAVAANAAPDVRQPRTMTLFMELQEARPFTPEQMAARQKDMQPDDPAAAADLALNNWKNCVIDSLARWAPLKLGAGTLIDGAFGRCVDVEREYRGHLMRIAQDGRQVVDVSMARSMTRMLEETWRSRLTAIALDQDLARQQAQVAPVSGQAPANATPNL